MQCTGGAVQVFWQVPFKDMNLSIKVTTVQNPQKYLFWEDDWNLEVRCLHVNIMNSSTFIKNINASFPVNNWKQYSRCIEHKKVLQWN